MLTICNVPVFFKCCYVTLLSWCMLVINRVFYAWFVALWMLHAGGYYEPCPVTAVQCPLGGSLLCLFEFTVRVGGLFTFGLQQFPPTTMAPVTKLWLGAAVMEEAPGSHGNHHVFTVTSDKHLSVSLLLFFALYFHLNFRGFADMLRVDAGTAHRRTWTQQDIPVPRTGRQLFLYGKTPPPTIRHWRRRQYSTMWHRLGQIFLFPLYSHQFVSEICSSSLQEAEC